MNIKKILDNIEKYHYVGCGETKCKIISSSDSKTEAREEAKKFLEPHWEDLIDTAIYLVTIKKSVKKGEWDEEKNFLLPGPIFMVIKKYIIKKNKNIKKISSEKPAKFFFSPKYLKSNKKIIKTDITSSVLKFQDGNFNKGLSGADIL